MTFANYAIIAVAIVVVFFAIGGFVCFLGWLRETWRLGGRVLNDRDD